MFLDLKEKDVETRESIYGNEPPKLCSKKPDEILLCEMRMDDEIKGLDGMED
jgi:hypothetical protein